MSRRIVQLLVGLLLYGAGCALSVRAGWGVDPWTVLAEGVALQTGIGLGWVTNLLGALVLLAWIPLRQRPGIGTLANVLLVGTAIQATLAVVPPATDPWTGAAMLGGGILLVALASGLYLGAGFGAGPRDGLMTGLHTRLGWPIWLCRLLVETVVLVLGWLLGGTVGIGTVIFAFAIGPLVHRALPLFALDRAERAQGRAGLSAPGTPADRLPA
ncbi:YitT family protein [Microbacterium sp. P05]|uniref:membrane protein YczE n=1 Tax=Microbacterium sp. P05 TaxID=3366948 RepID=UPI0037455C5D